MDEELKAYLDRAFAKVDDEFAAVRAEGQETKRELRAHTEDVETRLLSEFWKWARTADARYRQSIAVVGALDERVKAVEDRVAELERKRAS